MRGFTAFEFWNWWDKDLDDVVEQRDKNEVKVAACCTKFVSLVDPKLRSEAGVTLVIEPLNERVDHPGYYLVRSDEAFEVIDEVGSPNVKVVFDIYHQQVSEGDLIKNITDNIDKIGHFHAAGNPGRNELSSGEINYPEVFAVIEGTSYEGYVGLEYWPKRDAAAGLFEVASLFE